MAERDAFMTMGMSGGWSQSLERLEELVAKASLARPSIRGGDRAAYGAAADLRQSQARRVVRARGRKQSAWLREAGGRST
jgi:hypothetical protein